MLITFKILVKVSRMMLATAASLQAIEYIKEQRLKQVIYKQIKLALMPAVKTQEIYLFCTWSMMSLYYIFYMSMVSPFLP